MSLTKQEAVMGQPFPTQHPAVVLRSHFNLVRALLAVAMAAIVALSAAVVIVADDDELTASSSASSSETAPAPGTRYDGGPEEGTRAIIAVPQAPAARYDGGPDEGTRVTGTSTPAPAPERTTDGGGSDESSSQIGISRGPGGPH
jgi:hypothetical protein